VIQTPFLIVPLLVSLLGFALRAMLLVGGFVSLRPLSAWLFEPGSPTRFGAARVTPYAYSAVGDHLDAIVRRYERQVRIANAS